jgi:hypothetical protein
MPSPPLPVFFLEDSRGLGDEHSIGEGVVALILVAGVAFEDDIAILRKLIPENSLPGVRSTIRSAMSPRFLNGRRVWRVNKPQMYR